MPGSSAPRSSASVLRAPSRRSPTAPSADVARPARARSAIAAPASALPAPMIASQRMSGSRAACTAASRRAPSRNARAAAASENRQALPPRYPIVAVALAAPSIPTGLNVSPTPTVPPTSFSSSRVTTAPPSDWSASCHSPCPPSRTTAMSSVVSWRFERWLVRQGGRPAAAASAVRHRSPPTMQMPVRTVLPIRSPTPGIPAAAALPPARTAAMTRRIATYSVDACPAVRFVATVGVGVAVRTSPPGCCLRRGSSRGRHRGWTAGSEGSGTDCGRTPLGGRKTSRSRGSTSRVRRSAPCGRITSRRRTFAAGSRRSWALPRKRDRDRTRSPHCPPYTNAGARPGDSRAPREQVRTGW